MADCDITSNNNNATNDLTPAFTSSSLDSENIGNSNANVPNDGKKRKTHRLKQRFQVVKKLGQGTYGKVQLAINNETGQEVAIKTIKKNKVSNQQDLIRIRREIQIMSSINHPNIIHIFEVFENKDKIVLVMQYASGGELYDYVSFHKALSDDEARRVFRQVATAIYYCHKNKICHRDLKLENILLDEKGNAKIADFGLSNVFDDKHFLQTFCGSPLYASPEIVRGLPYFGPEVDCWSLGVLLYTLVYGAMPFDGSNFKKLVKQISEANYFEPPEKSPATDLIHKLLTPEPKERASIIDICIDPWVNQDCEHSLLQVAEDMSNLTNHAVRLDMLLALAPGSQPTEQQPEEETVKQDEDLKAAAADDDLSKKRPKETSSANDSLLDIAKKSTKKKSKKAASNKTAEPIEQPQQPMDEATVKPNEQEQLVKPSTDDKGANIQHEKQAPTVVEDSEMKTQSQSSLKSAESSSSMKRRGRVSIPDIWDDNQTKQAVNDDSGAQSPKKEPKSLGLQSSISQLNKDLEQRTKSAESLKSSSSSITKKSSTTVPDTKNDLKQQQQPQQQSIENVDDSSSNKVDANEESKSIAADQINNEMNEQKSAKNVDDSTEKGVETTSSQSSIKDENKSLAKQIIQKNIAKAKLMEKRQTSVQSNNSTTISGGGLQSGETTPLISIENSTISMLRQDSIGSSKNTFFSDAKTDKSVGQKSSVAASTKTDTNLILNPAPISRSYKKVIFTKDGAKITETGKFYSHEGDGFTTRVEKTSRITISGGGGVSSINDNTNNSSSTLQRSDSQDSTGSLDIFDDIFDDHWTDQLFSNARSLFNDFFGRRSDRLSLRSRAESLERSNFFNDDRFRSRDPFKAIDDFRNDSFASEKSLFNKKSIFNTSSSSASSFLKSSLSGSGKLNKSIFDDNDDDDNDGFMIGKKSSQSRMNDLREKYRLNRFSSGDNHNNQQQQMFNSSTTNNRMNRLFDSNDHLETQRKTRIDQWLDNNSNENVSEQFKEFNNCMNTYGTISRPSRLNMRPMMMTTSNDSLNLNLSSKHQNVKTDIIKRVEMTDSSTTCQVIRHKKTQMNDDLKITPKDIQFNFKLDDKTGSLILNNANIIIPNQSSTLSTSSSLSSTTQQQHHQYHQQQSKSSSATTIIEGSSNKIDDLKIEEPSSLLEKLRTVGYKKLVDRRLSDAASDDLPAPGGSASNSSKMTDKSSSKTNNNESSALN